jgi:hypothetical protein
MNLARTAPLRLALALIALIAVMLTAFVAFRAEVPRWEPVASTEQLASARTLLEQCRSGTGAAATVDERCFTTNFSTAVENLGPAAALTALDRLRVETPQYAFACHGAGHTAGAVAYRAAAGDLAKALVDLNPVCQGAYQHGVIEAWGAQRTGASTAELQDAFVAVARICDAAPAGPARELCFDGHGHAAWLTTANRSGNAQIEDAFALCLSSPTMDGRMGCAGGIVMQVFAPVTADTDPRPVDEIIPFCAAVPGTSWGSFTVDDTEFAATARLGCALGATYPFATAMITDRALGAEVMLDRYVQRCLALDGLELGTQRPVGPDCFDGIGFGLYYAAGSDVELARSWCEMLPAYPSIGSATELRARCAAKLGEAASRNG